MATEVEAPVAPEVSILPTNVSVMNDGYNHGSYTQPVMGVYALYQVPPPAPSPLGTVTPEPVVDEDEEAKAALAEAEAKVVTSPGKSIKPAASAANVETK